MTQAQASVAVRQCIAPQLDECNQVEAIRHTLQQQGDALLQLAAQFDEQQYLKALHLMFDCQGHVIICGMGKSGHVGRKLSATLASTGTPSFFLHPAEAFHGDLGMITPYDVVVLISNSGETDEILKLIPSLKAFGNRIIAITGGEQSTLANNADAVLAIVMQSEACPNNLAPTTSTTLTLAIGDALAVALIQRRQFKPNDFARYHPGGSLGRRLLTKVRDVMHTRVPTVTPQAGFRDIVSAITHGRQGMVVVNDDQGMLQGVITDGDLRRAMEKHEQFIDCCAAELMTRNPITLSPDTMLASAEELMTERRISALVIADETRTAVGLIRIFD